MLSTLTCNYVLNLLFQVKKDYDKKPKNGIKSRTVFKPTTEKDCDVKLRNGLKSSIVSKSSTKEDCYEKLKNESKSRIVSKHLVKENCNVELKYEFKSRIISKSFSNKNCDVELKNEFESRIIFKPMAKENCDVEFKNEFKSRIGSKPLAKENYDGKLNNELKSNIGHISSANEGCNVELKKEFESIIVSKPSIKEDRDIELDNRLKSNIDPNSSTKEDCDVEFKNEFKSIIVSKPLVKEDRDVELYYRLKSNVDPKFLAKEDCDVEFKNEPKSSIDSKLLAKVSEQKYGIFSSEISCEKKIEYLKCKYCGLISNGINDFFKHLSKVHYIVVSLRYNRIRFCPLCERDCKIDDFLKHIHNCVNTMKVGDLLLNQFLCTVCNVVFNDVTDCQFRKHFLFCKSFQKFDYFGKLHYKCINCTFESNNIDLCMYHASSTCLYIRINLKYTLNSYETEETKYLNEIKYGTKPFIDFDYFGNKYPPFEQLVNDGANCISVKQWYCLLCHADFKNCDELKAHYLSYSPCYTRAMASLIYNNQLIIKNEFIKKEPKTEPIN